MIINISKVQLLIACFFITSCSELSSFLPKPVDVPYSKNVFKLKNGAIGVAPKGYCIGPKKNEISTGNIIYTSCEIITGRGMISISYTPVKSGDTVEITRTLLANNQKILTTEYLDGYDLVKVENSGSSGKSVGNTVWRTAKVQKGYMVLAQYFSPIGKGVSDIHQVESLSASIDNFSPPNNLLDRQMFTPKVRPAKSKLKTLTSKIRPKLRP